MTDAFWSNLPALIGAVVLGIPAVMAAYMTWRGNQRADKASMAADKASKAAEIVRTTMASQLDDVHQQTQSIVANSGLVPLDKS